MAGIKNSVLVAKNADYTQSNGPNANSSENNGLVTDGQLWIGSTALNVGSTHINVGTLTSPDSSIAIGYSSPNVTIQAGTSVGTLKTLTPNEDFDGSAATPISGTSGNINTFGVNPSFSTVTETLNSTGTAAGNLQVEHRAWLTGLVVDASTTPGTRGTFSTIAAALTAAVSGQDIFIRSGTYTENLTLKAGVNLIAFTGDGQTPNVTIIGNNTFTSAGTVTISNIRLQTNSAAFLSVTGSAASIVNLENCYLNCSNNTGITFSTSSSSAQINIEYCSGNIATTGIALFAHSSAGTLSVNFSSFTNSGGSSTANTISAGNLNCEHTKFTNPITTSSTANIGFNFCIFSSAAQNVTALTHGGTGATSRAGPAVFESGSASAVSIGAGATLTMVQCEVNSTNTNAVTGAGTLIYSPIMFSGSSKIINTTTRTPLMSGTFTPTLIGQTAAGSTAYSVQLGNYTINGNLVTIFGSITTTSQTGTGNLNLAGFPFTIKNQANFVPVGSCFINSSLTYPASSTSLAVYGILNTTTAAIYVSGSGVAGGFLQMANVATQISYTLTYQI